MTFALVGSVMVPFRRLRFLFVVFFVRIWLLYALNLFSFPVPVA